MFTLTLPLVWLFDTCNQNCVLYGTMRDYKYIAMDHPDHVMKKAKYGSHHLQQCGYTLWRFKFEKNLHSFVNHPILKLG